MFHKCILIGILWYTRCILVYKEYYDLSMQIGEQVLFPAIRSADSETIIAAPGTSCRQQILDGTGVRAYHPVEILYQALV